MSSSPTSWILGSHIMFSLLSWTLPTILYFHESSSASWLEYLMMLTPCWVHPSLLIWKFWITGKVYGSSTAILLGSWTLCSLLKPRLFHLGSFDYWLYWRHVFSCLDIALSPPQSPEVEVPDRVVNPPPPLAKLMDSREPWPQLPYWPLQRQAGSELVWEMLNIMLTDANSN